MDELGFGLRVTAIGLGLVFGLLALLWLLLSAARRLEARRPEGRSAGSTVAASGSRSQSPEPRVAIRAVDGGADLEPGLIAAITVAVARQVERRRREAAPAMRTYWPGSLLFASRWVAAGRMRQSQSWRRRDR
jgi:hypothetical protein